MCSADAALLAVLADRMCSHLLIWMHHAALHFRLAHALSRSATRWEPILGHNLSRAFTSEAGVASRARNRLRFAELRKQQHLN